MQNAWLLLPLKPQAVLAQAVSASIVLILLILRRIYIRRYKNWRALYKSTLSYFRSVSCVFCLLLQLI